MERWEERKTRLSDQELERIFNEKNRRRVEFKDRVNEQALKEIRESIRVFVNDLPDDNRPGVIWDGGDDQGRATGINVTADLVRRLSALTPDSRILPPLPVSFEKRKLKCHVVAVVTAPPSESPPVRFRGRIYVANGSGRRMALVQDELILIEKRSCTKISFDVYPVHRT